MADTIRGNGLTVVEAALAAFVDNPDQLDRSRKRLMASPPSDCAPLYSHNSTRSQSPNAPNEEQRCRDECQLQLRIAWAVSLPNNQLSAQVLEEEKRVIQAVERGELHVLIGTNYYTFAKEAVRKGWVEQGIWNDNWNDMAQGRWKHEEPLEPLLESNAEPKGLLRPDLFSSLVRLNKNWGGERATKGMQDGRRAARERERDATRSFHQSMYQVSRERERGQSSQGEATWSRT
ncbi:hypothetical protein QBC36DRAFT_105154 [Triangularia setosa]|uniref:Uncharacterized protein n=1 Tax=Triangularia setosa TaxID=2587417 RepID=A0AAN6VX69_9PEZI|nr:hypothetical protein QBC36DRAFT_105154 [Podospora setosa]